MVVHVGKHMCTNRPSSRESFRIASGSDPDRQLRLERSWIGSDLNQFAVPPLYLDRLSTPEFAHGLNAIVHSFIAVSISLPLLLKFSSILSLYTTTSI